MRKKPKELRVLLATKASMAAKKSLSSKILNDPLIQRFSLKTVKSLMQLSVSAKCRCTNAKNVSFQNYGGRGIKFLFPSHRSFAEWVLLNLGPKPTALHSIDRIDNNRHYEPGNLRWATRAEQARNKRKYKRTAVGERARTIMTQRDDLTYETVRQWIHKGLTDDEIIQRRKYAGAGL